MSWKMVGSGWEGLREVWGGGRGVRGMRWGIVFGLRFHYAKPAKGGVKTEVLFEERAKGWSGCFEGITERCNF